METKTKYLNAYDLANYLETTSFEEKVRVMQRMHQLGKFTHEKTLVSCLANDLGSLRSYSPDVILEEWLKKRDEMTNELLSESRTDLMERKQLIDYNEKLLARIKELESIIAQNNS